MDDKRGHNMTRGVWDEKGKGERGIGCKRGREDRYLNICVPTFSIALHYDFNIAHVTRKLRVILLMSY